jgi:hypothetical protein
MVLLSFDGWWEGQVVFTQIYWMITIPATIIFLIQLALTFVKKDKKIDPITRVGKFDHFEKKISFQLVNFRNFIGFFTALGWSGLACFDSGLSTEFTLVTSFVCGVVVMFTMAIVFYFMEKLMDTVSESLD